jgi:hypothetical protein
LTSLKIKPKLNTKGDNKCQTKMTHVTTGQIVRSQTLTTQLRRTTMANFSVQTRLYFDCNENADEERIKLAKHLDAFDEIYSWEIHVITLHTNDPAIVLNYPVAEAKSVAKALTLWEENNNG